MGLSVIETNDSKKLPPATTTIEDLAEFKDATKTLTTDLRELLNYYNTHIRVLERVWDGIPALIFFKDSNNRLLKVNNYMAEFLGKSVAELTDVSMDDLGWDDIITEKFFKNDKDVIRNMIPKLGIVEQLGGSSRAVLTNKYPIFNEDQSAVIGILGISTII